MAKQSISVTLEPTTIETLRKMAAAEYRNISNMIDYIVAQYALQQQESAPEKTSKAALFGSQVKVTPYKETQNQLAKNMHLDDEDLAYLGKNQVDKV